ncbi:hypothetical protein EOL70_16925 [Leucothrix sargassi]|nr:hypothetical protein EOL70_16925 [Leucothrix sargassi]
MKNIFTLKAQFRLNVASQAFSKLVTIGSQLAVLPLMMIFWGAERYGVWLIISALPTYMSMANLGLAQISASEMTMRMARGDKAGVIAINHTGWVFHVCVCGVLLGLLVIFVAYFPISETFNLEVAKEKDISFATFFLGVMTIITILFGMVTAAMRSVGLYWLATGASALATLINSVLIVSTGFFGGGVLIASLLNFSSMLIVYFTVSFVFYRKYPDLKPGFNCADMVLLKKIIGPSFSYMSYTLSDALNINGSSILVGYFFGPSYVVIINAIRTLSRVGRSMASLVINSLEPIFAQIYGSKKELESDKIYRLLLLSSGVGVFIYLIFMYFFGQDFLFWWTKGVVDGYEFLFFSMVVSVALEVFWYSMQTPFVSTNRHSMFANYFLFLSLFLFGLLFLLFGYYGLDALGFISVLRNLLMVFISAIIIRKLSSNIK